MGDAPRPKAIEGLEVRAVGDEVLVHQPAAKKIHVLNETAGEILRLCDGTRSRDEIVAIVSQSRSAEIDVVDGDVQRLLAQFQELGLVENR